jgi:hypothetical protein
MNIAHQLEKNVSRLEYYRTYCLSRIIKHLQTVAKLRIQLRAYVHLLTYYLCHVDCKSLEGNDLTPHLVHTIDYAANFHDST